MRKPTPNAIFGFLQIGYGKLQYSQTLALESQCDIRVATYDPSIRNHKYSAPNKFYESLMLGKPIIMAKDILGTMMCIEAEMVRNNMKHFCIPKRAMVKD